VEGILIKCIGTNGPGQETIHSGKRLLNWPLYTKVATTYYGPQKNVPNAENVDRRMNPPTTYSINTQHLLGID
jgi:hypothetical protein